MNKKGFTLAEVLITLGIVGIVAAMTIPNLIGNYRKKIIETRLQRFYSVANNALKYSETENGSWDFWYFGTEATISETKKWYDTYLAKYWKTIKTEVISGGYVAAYFPDGSLVIIKSGKDYLYYPEAKKYTESNFSRRKYMGRDLFPFCFYPQRKNKQNYKKGIQPYLAAKTSTDSEGNIIFTGKFDYTLDELYNDPLRGCRNNPTSSTTGAYCTQIIFQNGWKIPENYPFKF